jgi:short-subunit dehydrogenase
VPETVLITGASSGIGLELARCFAADGAALVLVARTREKLEALAARLREQHGVSVYVLTKDLAHPRAPDEIAEELTRNGIDVDVLVNNAGFGLGGTFAELELAAQMDMIQVNVASLVKLTGLLLPGMKQRRGGGVLNVGSTAAFQPGPNLAVYFATKSFVLSFSEALHEELAASGVSVTCLAPGPTATGFAERASLEKSLLFRFNVQDAASVARAGHRAFRRGKALVIPGLLNKLTVFAVRLGPRALVRRIAGRLPRE